MFWNFIGDLTRLIFLKKEQTIQSRATVLCNTEPSLSDVSQMASPLCGKPAGRKARVLRLMIEILT
jgi:hypothetical protein